MNTYIVLTSYLIYNILLKLFLKIILTILHIYDYRTMVSKIPSLFLIIEMCFSLSIPFYPIGWVKWNS